VSQASAPFRDEVAPIVTAPTGPLRCEAM
jgi:hypothetical protein